MPKQPLLLICLVTAFFSCNAQNLNEKDVPSAIKEKFASMHPNVKNVTWEMEDGKYEAEFEENKIEMSLLFDGNGTYVQSEVEIEAAVLPQGVVEYTKQNLGGKKIEEAAKITGVGGDVTYEAEVGSNDYLFDAAGNFLRMESENERADDDK